MVLCSPKIVNVTLLTQVFMILFFILYWGTLLLGYIAFRSFQNYRRQHVMRHAYAERHRMALRSRGHFGGFQSRLF